MFLLNCPCQQPLEVVDINPFLVLELLPLIFHLDVSKTIKIATLSDFSSGLISFFVFALGFHLFPIPLITIVVVVLVLRSIHLVPHHG